MRLNDEQKLLVELNALEVGLQGRLVRIGDSWAVVGHDPNQPRLWAGENELLNAPLDEIQAAIRWHRCSRDVAVEFARRWNASGVHFTALRVDDYTNGDFRLIQVLTHVVATPPTWESGL